MWKLVAITISLGLVTCISSNPADRIEKTDVNRKSTPFFFSSHADTPPESQFLCHKKPSGYYADPRFGCEVFHFCHNDGTRVTIPCHQDNQPHRICLLKDIASRACDGSEIYLALPEDLHFKGSKDTTASALNGATEYKLSDVLPEPTTPPEDTRSTTPLDSEERRSLSKPSFNTREVSSVYEVFNSFLKEIQGVESRPDRPRPSTFSRGSRVPSVLEQKDSLVDVAPSIIDRRVDDGPYLVEVYNNDDGGLGDTDYSAYRRKSKKLFFNSNKKTPAKHPRRRKRTVPDQRSAGRPYAIIYAKVPDTTLASEGGDNAQPPRERQDVREFTFGQGMVHGKKPMVPVTIETRRKKNKPKKPNSPAEQTGFQQTSEQQNVYYYAPDQVGQLGLDGRAVSDPRLRVPESAGQPRQNPPQPQEDPQNARQAPYSPQAQGPLQLPNFPFQPQSFLNTQRQPFYYDPQGGYTPYSSFGSLQGQPQQPETPAPQQSPRPSSHPQPLRQREPTNGPSQAPGNAGVPGARARPPPSSQPQGFSGYPFFQNFPGFDEFTSSFSQRDPAPYNLLQQQPPLFSQPQFLNPGRPAQERPQTQFLNPGRPTQERPQPQFLHPGRPSQERPQPQEVHTRPETPRPGISVALQPGRDPSVFGPGVPQQDRTRQPPVNSQAHPQRPRGRPDEHVPVIVQEIPRHRPQSTRQPPNINAPRQRPVQHPSQYDPRLVLQPQYSPESLIVRPDIPQSPPIREEIPHDNPEGDNRPVVLLEDFREPTQPHHVGEVVHAQREPVPERIRHPENDEPPRRPEDNRNQDERPRRPDGNRNPQRQQSSHYFTPTISPPSTRSRTRTRQPTRNEPHRPRPEEEESEGGRNHVEFGHRRPSPPEERPTHGRPRPSISEGIPVDSRFFERPPSQNRRPPSEVPNAYRSQTPGPTRHRTTPRERTRHRPQPQIERPPSEYVQAEPLPETYDGHQGYYTYPPQGNDINGVSTVDEPTSRPRTPPTATIRRPSHRGTVRNPHNLANPTIEGGFIPMTEAPHRASTYQTRPSSNEFADPNEDHRRPEKVQNNRYQDVGDIQTTRHPETTRRPTPKRKPPPKPTFPPFPTFPPPPRRPITSPKPPADVSEYPKEGDGESHSRRNEQSAPHLSTSVSQPQIDAIYNPSFNRDPVTEEYLQTAAPEVTTRRRTRKRKQRPRRPKPTSPYIEDDQTPGETITQPTTVKDVVTHSSPRQHGTRWQQQSTSRRTTEATTTPASAKSEEFGSRINLFGRQRPRKPVARGGPSTTSPLLREESVRVSNPPTATTRGRKAFAKRMRVKTTTTESPETDGPVARSDENTEVLSYRSGDDIVTDFPESESSTFFPYLESTTELTAYTTESYNEMVDTTDEVTTSGYDAFATDVPEEERMGDFESTRSIRKKFQNRPRVLKFGKPKLRSTLSPLDLNAAESRIG